jgi:hypothetical protein
LPRLAVLLGPPDPAQVRAFDPASQPLVIPGKEFLGGGAPQFGFGLWVPPGRRLVSEVGNYVYGQGTDPADRMTAWFRLPAVPPEGLRLTLLGVRCPQPPGAEVRGEVRVNGGVVFAGQVPLDEREITPLAIAVAAQALKGGVNALEIRNTEPGGRVGARPWFGVDRVELSTAP